MFFNTNSNKYIKSLCSGKPNAGSQIRGSKQYPQIRGNISFYQIKDGVLVTANVQGLPIGQGACGAKVFGFHIHAGTSCTGNRDDPFADAAGHYNPNNCKHPHHSGDMPPLFENNGSAFSTFLTNRFTVNEIIGRTVIIHDSPDDFTTQPAGNSGNKIACGIIRKS